jgi:hypothetical protein
MIVMHDRKTAARRVRAAVVFSGNDAKTHQRV